MSFDTEIVHNLSVPARRERRPIADQRVLEAIYQAILEQRLPPGTKLGEEALGEIFDVSRTRIRRVLLSLFHLQVVELHPNRGAFVASPSEREARHVFEARRTIELTVLRRILDETDSQALTRLRPHIQAERKAQERGDRHQAIRLSGAFHVVLAEISGNEVLRGFLENLVLRSSLILGLYGNGVASSCAYQEHEEILDALMRCDGKGAVMLMERHLAHVEGALRLGDDKPAKPDLKAIFADRAAPRPGKRGR